MPETISTPAGREVPRFATIREVARMGFIGENALRVLVKQERCPGFYTGRVFRVNVGALIDALNRAGGTIDTPSQED